MRNLPNASSRRASFLLALAALVVLSCRAPVRAEASDDPVEEFQLAKRAFNVDRGIPRDDDADRRPLREAMLKQRKEALEKLATRIVTLRDLSRVLLLREWDTVSTDREIGAIDRDVHRSVATRFLTELKKRLDGEDATLRAAAVALVGEMTTVIPGPPAGVDGRQTRDFLVRSVVPELVKLSKTENESVGSTLAISLGQTWVNTKDVRTPADTARIFAALADLRVAKSVVVRRSVAEAMAIGMQYISEQDKDPKTIKSPENEREVMELIDTIGALTFQSLADTDGAVRKASLANARRVIRVLGNFEFLALRRQPDFVFLNWRPPTPAEKTFIQETRTALNKEFDTLRPKVDELHKYLDAIKSCLNDPDPTIRLATLQLLEDIAVFRSTVRMRVQAVPNVDEKPADGGGEEKKDKDSAQKPANPGDWLDQVYRSSKNELIASLKYPDAEVRLSAALVIENLGPDAVEAAPLLVERLKDTNRFVAWAAARALGRISATPPAGAIDGLARLLQHPDMSVRIAAATALNSFGPKAAGAVNDLLAAASVGDPDIRRPVLLALGAIGKDGAKAVPVIGAQLSHPDARVRRAAAEAVSKFGKDISLAEKELKAALGDDDADVRRFASEALLNIPR